MDIEESIKTQNVAFAFAVNRKLGFPLPESLIQSQLDARKDPFTIAKLAVRTKREIDSIESGSRASTTESEVKRWDQFINWIMRRK
jgi:hypothetical protein